MTCLYDHQIFQVQRYGGISRYFFEIISRLARSGELEIDLFQGLNVNGYGLEKFKPHFRRYFGMRKPEIPRATPLFSAANQLLLRGFARTRRSDIYHSTYYSDLLPSFQGRRVVTVYDMIHELFPENFVGDPTSARKRTAVERADRVISISHSTKQDLVRIFGIPPEKIEVVHLANSLRQPAPTQRLFADPYLLYVGGRRGYKNFEMFLKVHGASETLRKNFKVICFGDASFSEAERMLIAELNLGDSVLHVAGTDEALANYYGFAEAFIYPSRYEGFGLPVLEAMHYGCPVICGKTSSVPEVAGDAAVYFDPTDLESMKTTLESTLADSDRLRELRRAGPAREAQFSWDKCAQETLQVYRGLVQ